MTLLCLLLAGAAAWLAVRPSPTAASPRAAPRRRQLGPGSRRARWPAVVAVALGLVALAGWLGGGRSAALAAAGAVGVLTTVRLMSQHRRSRAALRGRAEVAHACSLLASQLRVGRVPTEALRTTAEDCPVLATAARVVEIGGDPVPVWRTESGRPGQRGLLDLARAWQMAGRTGAPLAPALERVAEALTEDSALRRLVAGELAAPRATGKIMAVLPLLGIGIGYAIGGSPVQFLLAGPYGWACLVAGAALAALGVLWIEALAAHAAEEG